MKTFNPEKASKILAMSKIGLWRVEFEEDKPSRFFADPTMDELLGLEDEVTPEERFRFHRKYIHPDDLAMFDDYATKLMEERTEVTYRYLHPTQGEMFVRCGGVKDPSVKEFSCFYGTHQNISDTIRYEKEKYAETRLAEAVAEKEKALKQARRASAAKTEFLSRMSHDIRTPLNGIIGLLQISEAHADDVELLAANRAKAMLASEHLLSLINDVLDMTKLEDENIILPHEPINIYDICNEAITICSIRAKENGIELFHNGGDGLTHTNVYGSSLHLKQVFLNVLNNCIKYNKPHGSITTNVEAVSQTENTITYRFCISDTGIGMSPEFQRHLFEPFTQEKNDARSRYQGTGMGMAIVKRLVTLMKGKISVQSQLGVGSKFEIILPFEINHEKVDDTNQEQNENLSIDGMRILLAEDNELNREIAECMLIDAGAEVTVACDGQEAVEIFEKSRAGSFDAILMDIMMPRLDGYAATEKIRCLDKADAETIPVIAMTANAFADDIQKAKNAGMNEHLSKPVRIEKLVLALSKYYSDSKK